MSCLLEIINWLLSILLINSCWSFPLNGNELCNNSYVIFIITKRITPNDQVSTLKSSTYFDTTSGGIYSVVPHITFSTGSYWTLMAHPKSHNFKVPSSLIKMFSNYFRNLTLLSNLYGQYYSYGDSLLHLEFNWISKILHLLWIESLDESNDPYYNIQVEYRCCFNPPNMNTISLYVYDYKNSELLFHFESSNLHYTCWLIVSKSSFYLYQ